MSLSAPPGIHGISGGHFRLILGPDGPEVYSLKQDPGERRPLSKHVSLPAAHLRQSYLHHLITRPPPADEESAASPGEPETALDEITRERLRLLGYVE